MTNESKGNMYEFITHTWNAIKGVCPHNCSYCHPDGTMILMSDFTQKNIKNVKVGEKIIGLIKTDNVGFYKFAESVVVNASHRKDKTIIIKTEDGKIECTKEHPLMGSTEKRNCSDWKSARSFSPYEHIRYLTKNGRGNYSLEHKTGYVRGLIDGDGKEGNEYLGFEMVCIDEQLRNKVKEEFIDLFGIVLRDGVERANSGSYGNDCLMITTRRSKDVEFFNTKTLFRLNEEFAKGYIAGMIDTDGGVGTNGTIRISQSITANALKYQKIIDCCELLKLNYHIEKDGIRILSNFQTRIKILFDFGIFHSVKSKRLIFGSSVKGSKHSEIRSIEQGSLCDVYNLQTECENFIANGFIVHNCYMKRFPQRPIRFDKKELITNLDKNRFIFVGSSCDMFAESIPQYWIDETLNHCSKFDNQYFFQSKNPKRMCESKLPENSSVCTTIETNRWYPEIMNNSPRPEKRASAMQHAKRRSYVTVEPIMDFDLIPFIDLIETCNPSQVNIGADSGNNNLPEPPKEKITELIQALKELSIKVHLKSNLKRLMSGFFAQGSCGN